MYPGDEILTELFTRFTLSKDSSGRDVRIITYSGKEYPVYSVVPKNTSFDYVSVNPIELVDDSTKDNNSYECTQLFDIVTFGGERGSWKAANHLADEILKALMKQEIVTQNFKSTVWPIIDSTNNFVEDVEGGLVMRKLIRFRYNLEQTGDYK